MSEDKNFHLNIISAEEVAYKLFKGLKDEIQKEKQVFCDMEDQARQQYLLDLFKACMNAVKDQRPCAPKIGLRET